MLSSILNSLESFIITNGSWTVFFGCILEQIIVPIPASLIVLSSTFIIMKGVEFPLPGLGILFLKIVIPASLGITLGSLFYYILAYKWGVPFVEATGKYLMVSVEDVWKVENKVKKSRYDDVFIFLARCLPIIPSIAINLFCGLIKYDLKKYLITTFMGSMVQIFAWGLLAWLAGNIYLVLVDKISLLGNIMILIILLIIIYYVIIQRNECRRKHI